MNGMCRHYNKPNVLLPSESHRPRVVCDSLTGEARSACYNDGTFRSLRGGGITNELNPINFNNRSKTQRQEVVHFIREEDGLYITEYPIFAGFRPVREPV